MALEVKFDHVAEALDDLTALCEHWKRNRERGRMPRAIRAALLMSMREALAMHDADAKAAKGNALQSLADELDRIGADMVESSPLRPKVATVALGMRNLARHS
ncbi:hypothetical protein [Accumulibacter sp.]|uniref:hypothetical protein n=1 Tax=Accumulibacter sp. TaxID=2053492 RepID=UPI0025E7B0A7|nr:hypothetical protein [Accumulibacter sp.]MCM8613750.1 hypothetical protein [Accumulibacter sp.]MCM8637973.1 hypothetical protein [Accumulibacter sp.]MCM8641310.1 hypothetical protein [Accumulibacter sp.]